MITVITPTYNRVGIIKNVYDSLLNQTNYDFEWIVIDDGSKDNTKEMIDSFIKDKKIKISYFFKQNGGKHTALNLGIKKAKGDYILILDSDDTLLPDAIEKVIKKWEQYDADKSVACLSFLKVYPNNQTIGKEYNGSDIKSNNIDFRYNQNLLGDMCEVFKTEILKKYPFPVYENERFLSEAIVWNQIAFDYNTIYINEPIYVADYLTDGLSKNWFKLVVNNPLGARANNLLFMSKEFKFKIRLKNCIMFDVFSIIAKKPILKETKMKFFAALFYIPSFIIAKILEYKFKKKN